MKKLVLGTLVLLAASEVAAQNAQFCVISSSGRSQCTYQSLGYCRQVAQATGGMCAPNTQSGQNTNQSRPSSFGEGFARGFNESRNARLEHERQVRLIEAQIRQLEAETKAIEAEKMAEKKPEGSYLYLCKDSEGNDIYRVNPIPGCVVSDIQSP